MDDLQPLLLLIFDKIKILMKKKILFYLGVFIPVVSSDPSEAARRMESVGHSTQYIKPVIVLKCLLTSEKSLISKVIADLTF